MMDSFDLTGPLGDVLFRQEKPIFVVGREQTAHHPISGIVSLVVEVTYL
jgi:hypothetical protein